MAIRRWRETIRPGEVLLDWRRRFLTPPTENCTIEMLSAVFPGKLVVTI
jgi:hypothetical protein